MAYGFRCKKCNHQEKDHYTEDGNRECFGFEYKEKDIESLILERFDDLMECYQFSGHKPLNVDLPELVHGRVEEMLRDHWLNLGYEDGLPPVRHELTTLFATSRGLVVIDTGS